MIKQFIIIAFSVILGTVFGLLWYPNFTDTYLVNYTVNSTNTEYCATYTISKLIHIDKKTLEEKMEKKLNSDITIDSISSTIEY